MLCEKAYKDAHDLIRALYLQKMTKQGYLSCSEKRSNKNVSSNGIIVENYFGGLVQAWYVMKLRYHLREKSYDTLLRLCFMLTNAHVECNPLRSLDGKNLESFLRRLFNEAVIRQDKKQSQQVVLHSIQRSRITLMYMRFDPAVAPSRFTFHNEHGFTNSKDDGVIVDMQSEKENVEDLVLPRTV